MARSGIAHRIEHATWGALILWLGVLLAVDERDGVGFLGAGAILFASALLQRLAGHAAGAPFWIGGGVLLYLGFDDLYGLDDVPVAAIALIVLGALILLRAVTGRRWPGA